MMNDGGERIMCGPGVVSTSEHSLTATTYPAREAESTTATHEETRKKRENHVKPMEEKYLGPIVG